MKIFVTTRTMNEERNVRRFIEGYHDLPEVAGILISDGGSIDKTIPIAKSYPKVEVREFKEQVEVSGVKRNPHGRHINSIIDWAFEDRGADWIIFDDCDCFPTAGMKQYFGSIFSEAEEFGMLAIMALRLYVYGDSHYFPKLAEAGQSIWAWKRDARIMACENNPITHLMMNIPQESRQFKLQPPAALLHCSWPNEEEVKRKMEFYKAIRGHEIPHPRESFGPLEPLPWWAVE